MNIYTCIHIYVYIYIYIYKQIYTCIHIYIDTNFMCIYINAHLHTHMHIHIYLYTHMYLHTYMYVYIYLHIYTCMYMHVYTCMPTLMRPHCKAGPPGTSATPVRPPLPPPLLVLVLSCLKTMPTPTKLLCYVCIYVYLCVYINTFQDDMCV